MLKVFTILLVSLSLQACGTMMRNEHAAVTANRANVRFSSPSQVREYIKNNIDAKLRKKFDAAVSDDVILVDFTGMRNPAVEAR